MKEQTQLFCTNNYPTDLIIYLEVIILKVRTTLLVQPGEKSMKYNANQSVSKENYI